MPNANSQRSVVSGSTTTPESSAPTVLWWSRSGRDYSRDRIVRNAFRELGWKIDDFQPTFSRTASLEATLRNLKRPNLIWVPCFRQRDVLAAQTWAKKNSVPLVFDPLISAWDKQVFERRKFDESSRKAKRLLRHESKMFSQSDIVVADTESHAQLFCNAHELPASKSIVIPVSAEEELFSAQDKRNVADRPQVLFFGSFIGLQGPQHIAKAATRVTAADWSFIGSGPLLKECVRIAGDSSHIRFLPRVAYEELPTRIADADILMGIFGDSTKASRVIPNKVYQSLACGRPVVTRLSNAYPASLRQMPHSESGISWTECANANSIEGCVKELLSAGCGQWRRQGVAARKTYESLFSNERVTGALLCLLQQLSLHKKRLKPAA